jgi:hypothetical protein
MRLFRERLLRSLLDQHAISPELVQRLLASVAWIRRRDAPVR